MQRRLDPVRVLRVKRVKLNSYYLKKYGFSLEYYENLVKEVENKCERCGKVPRGRLVVDEWHSPDSFRGLLCRGCNLLIGRLGDSLFSLGSVILYLAKKEEERYARTG